MLSGTRIRNDPHTILMTVASIPPHVCTNVHVPVYTNVYTHVYTHIHAHIHANVHVHAYMAEPRFADRGIATTVGPTAYMVMVYILMVYMVMGI